MQPANVCAVITGGASGLGLATARHLVAHGAKVALLDVQAERGEAAAAELGPNAIFLHTDVTSENDAVSRVGEARDHMQGLNVAINCAGILGAGRVLGKEGPMSLSLFETTVRVNLIGSTN